MHFAIIVGLVTLCGITQV